MDFSAPREGISAVLIVRNEEAHLPACLESLHSIADEIVVVDTGSTDNTIAIAKEHGACIFTFPWCDDFAAARNFSLDQAAFTYALILDADERVLNPESARELLLAFMQHPPHVAGTVEIINQTLGDHQSLEVIDQTPRFFHCGAFRYTGAIHEQLTPLAGMMSLAPTGLRVLHLGYALAPEQARAKAERNIRLLQREVEAHPEDEYFRYQLGKSLYSIQAYAEAAETLGAALARIDWTAAAPTGAHGAVSRKVMTDLLTTLAYAYANTDAVVKARGLLLEHLALGHEGTQRADFLHVLGYIELMLGDLEASRAAYDMSLLLGPESEDVRGTGSFASEYHLGLLAEAWGNRDEAWRHYAAALRARSDHEVTLRRVVDLSAEQQIPLPPEVLETADPAAFFRVYVACLRHFLDNARMGEASFLAKQATKLNPELFKACREALQAYLQHPK